MVKKFGEIYKLYREAKKITLRDIEHKGISRSQLSRFEKGETDLTTSKFLLALEQINVPIEEFMYAANDYKRDRFYQIVDEVKQCFLNRNVTRLHKLLIERNAMKYIKLAREMFFNVIVYSNISMLNKQSIKTLSTLYIDYISCTIFSMDEVFHDRITNKKGSLKKCLQNLELLEEFGIQIEIKTPLFEQNIHSIDDVFEFCKKNNFKYKVDTQIVPRRGTVNNKVRVKSLTLKQLISIQKKIDIINGVRFIDKNENFLTCSSVQVSLYITCLGSVQPCSLYSISIGNIYNASIKEIWNKSMFNKIASYSLKDSKSCSTCTIANYCTQCPGIALSETGNSRNCSEICKKTALARSFVYASIP